MSDKINKVSSEYINHIVNNNNQHELKMHVLLEGEGETHINLVFQNNSVKNAQLYKMVLNQLFDQDRYETDYGSYQLVLVSGVKEQIIPFNSKSISIADLAAVDTITVRANTSSVFNI